VFVRSFLRMRGWCELKTLAPSIYNLSSLVSPLFNLFIVEL
jgi:hypothetical protein